MTKPTDVLSSLSKEDKDRYLTRVLSCISIQEDNEYNGSYCWLWTRHLTRGYGRVRIFNNRLKAHRVFYQLLVGNIPDGLQLDHLCRVKACCNPEHLEPVTSRENTLRGTGASAVNAKKKCCGVCGGPFHYSSRSSSKWLQRKCKLCINKEARIRMAKKRAMLKNQKSNPK